MSKVAIYALINPLTEHIFYVGATKEPKPRLITHLCCKDNSDRTKIISSITSTGLRPEMVILEYVFPDEARDTENFYITLFEFYGFTLFNSMKSHYGVYRHDREMPHWFSEKKFSASFMSTKFIVTIDSRLQVDVEKLGLKIYLHLVDVIKKEFELSEKTFEPYNQYQLLFSRAKDKWYLNIRKENYSWT